MGKLFFLNKDIQMTCEKIAETRNHRAMILNQRCWSSLFLTLKKDKPLEEIDVSKDLGILFAAENGGKKKVVRMISVLELPETLGGVHDLPNVQYDSVDELLADNWVVD